MSPDRSRRAGRRLRPELASCGAVALLIACGGGSGAPPGEERPAGLPERDVRSVVWDTLFRAGGTLQDTLFQGPSRLAADTTGVFVVDHHAGRLLRFDRSGRLLWSWGGRGRGPDELAQPRDLQVDARGRAWILDVENARLVVVRPEGDLETRIPLDAVGVPADVFVPLDDGGAILIVADPERSLVQLDRAGAVVERRPFPWEGFRRLDPLASQLVTARDPGSQRWAGAFALGDGFFGFEADRWLGYRAWYVEAVAFPRVRVRRRRIGIGRSVRESWVESPRFAAGSLGFDGERLIVHFHGRTPDAGRWVDSYRLADGTYLESLRLPARANRLSYADSVYYLLVENPYPELLALAPRPLAAADAGR